MEFWSIIVREMEVEPAFIDFRLPVNLGLYPNYLTVIGNNPMCLQDIRIKIEDSKYDSIEVSN